MITFCVVHIVAIKLKEQLRTIETDKTKEYLDGGTNGFVLRYGEKFVLTKNLT